MSKEIVDITAGLAEASQKLVNDSQDTQRDPARNNQNPTFRPARWYLVETAIPAPTGPDELSSGPAKLIARSGVTLPATTKSETIYSRVAIPADTKVEVFQVGGVPFSIYGMGGGTNTGLCSGVSKGSHTVTLLEDWDAEETIDIVIEGQTVAIKNVTAQDFSLGDSVLIIVTNNCAFVPVCCILSENPDPTHCSGNSGSSFLRFPPTDVTKNNISDFWDITSQTYGPLPSQNFTLVFTLDDTTDMNHPVTVTNGTWITPRGHWWIETAVASNAKVIAREASAAGYDRWKIPGGGWSTGDTITLTGKWFNTMEPNTQILPDQRGLIVAGDNWSSPNDLVATENYACGSSAPVVGAWTLTRSDLTTVAGSSYFTFIYDDGGGFINYEIETCPVLDDSETLLVFIWKKNVPFGTTLTIFEAFEIPFACVCNDNNVNTIVFDSDVTIDGVTFNLKSD